MSVTIQLRGDSAANWTSANPIPYARELCIELDTHKAKFGDGSTRWAELPYWALGSNAVFTVFDRVGDVTGQDGDYTAEQVGALDIHGGNLLGWIGPKEVTLTQSGGNVAINAESGNSFVLPLTSSGWTILVPTNPSPGQVIRLHLGQDPTGSRTVAWAAGWNFGAGSAPTLTTTPGAVDILVFEYVTLLSAWCYVGLAPSFSPPPQSIAFVDSVGSTYSDGIGVPVTLRLPGDLAVGNAVILGTVAWGQHNVDPTAFTITTNGISVPTPLDPMRAGIFGTGAQVFGFYVQPGDLDVEGGGTATLTITPVGTDSEYVTSASLGAWSGMVLPPGAIGQSTSVSGGNSYVAPTAVTTADGSWEVAVVMTGNGLSTTFPGSLTARTPISVAVCIADNGAPLAADTTIGGETWGSNAGSVAFHAYTIAADAA